MKMTLSFLSALLLCASVSFAEDKAATGDLPEALQALGLSSNAVVSVQDAHQVRGQGGTISTPNFSQNLGFSITNGTAVGSTTLLEGVLGNFKFANVSGGTSLTAEGVFGGLQGSIGVNSGALSFAFQGKAFQQQFDFGGTFNQNFSQTFRR